MSKLLVLRENVKGWFSDVEINAKAGDILENLPPELIVRLIAEFPGWFHMIDDKFFSSPENKMIIPKQSKRRPIPFKT